MLRCLLIGILLLPFEPSIAQNETKNVIPNRFIVECAEGFDLKKWVQSKSLKINEIRPIFKKYNYWLLEFSGGKRNQQKQIKLLQSTQGIVHVQQDMYARFRRLPDDEFIPDQWALDLIEVAKVWDITTGGTTQDGREIVVAVIDDGYDIDHEDIVDNLWVNTAEIPDNDLDDDGNGYEDDYFGLHLPSQTDNHLEIDHGTSVAGIVGAKGNNTIGMSGINWDIKIMHLSLARSTGSTGGSVSDIIEAYQYALDQREKYNDTNGAEGAFVVATNFSGGIEQAFPDDVPMWCPIYEELGRAGIINISAVANEDINVEIEGDIPSLCSSDFLITTTNTDINDQKIVSAAFGSLSVDLGAPGEDALSTIKDNRYREFSGTSSSAPHVAGVAALLYSLPCTNLLEMAKEDPPVAALLVKRAILDGVNLNADLSGITVTGGRLNAYNAFVQLDKEAPVLESCPEDVTIFEADSTYLWDEPTIVDDCGGVMMESTFERGRPFRLGTTEIVLTATDLLGNSATCSFHVTKEGSTEQNIEFLEVENVLFDRESDLLSVNFETGSFEVHIIDIYNMIGQRLLHQLYIPISSGSNRVDIPGVSYPTGAYVLVLSKAGGALRSSRKFVMAQ